jgi:hypothetical protein
MTGPAASGLAGPDLARGDDAMLGMIERVGRIVAAACAAAAPYLAAHVLLALHPAPRAGFLSRLRVRN